MNSDMSGARLDDSKGHVGTVARQVGALSTSNLWQRTPEGKGT